MCAQLFFGRGGGYKRDDRLGFKHLGKRGLRVAMKVLWKRLGHIITEQLLLWDGIVAGSG